MNNALHTATETKILNAVTEAVREFGAVSSERLVGMRRAGWKLDADDVLWATGWLAMTGKIQHTAAGTWIEVEE